METAFLWLSVDILLLDDRLMKLLISILVVIANYVLSKLFIFKGKEN